MKFNRSTLGCQIHLDGQPTRRARPVPTALRRRTSKIGRQYGRLIIAEQLAAIPTAADLAAEKEATEKKAAQEALDRYYELKSRQREELWALLDAIPEEVKQHIAFDYYEGFHAVYDR